MARSPKKPAEEAPPAAGARALVLIRDAFIDGAYIRATPNEPVRMTRPATEKAIGDVVLIKMGKAPNPETRKLEDVFEERVVEDAPFVTLEDFLAGRIDVQSREMVQPPRPPLPPGADNDTGLGRAKREAANRRALKDAGKAPADGRITDPPGGSNESPDDDRPADGEVI